MEVRLNGTAGNARDQSSEGISGKGDFRCAALRFPHDIADEGKDRLLGRRPGEIRLWPNKRAPYFLILSQRQIGAFNYRSWVTVGAIQQKYGARLGVAVAFGADHDAIANAGLRAQGFFQILRVNIQAGRSDDDVFTPALEIQVASPVRVRYISRSEPSVGFGYGQRLPILPVGCRHVFAAHQNFAIPVNPHFHARKHFADGALGGAERVIQADERCGFRHPVSLDDGVSQSSPERLGLLGKRSASRDESPEFPAKSRVNLAEAPPTPEKMLVLSQCESFLKLFDLAVALRVTFDFASQRFDEAGNRNDHRDPLPPDRVHELRGPERIDENDGASQHRRNEQAEHLAKNMAEGKQVQKAKRVDKLFIAKVFLNFSLQRFDIREDVAVREHNAAGLGCGA